MPSFMCIAICLVIIQLHLIFINTFSLVVAKNILLEPENICSFSWRNLETTLKIPKITFEDYKHNIRKDICIDKSFSCCTKHIERSLVDLAKELHFDVLIRKNVATLKSQFINFSSKFDRKSK